MLETLSSRLLKPILLLYKHLDHLLLAGQKVSELLLFLTLQRSEFRLNARSKIREHVSIKPISLGKLTCRFREIPYLPRVHHYYWQSSSPKCGDHSPLISTGRLNYDQLDRRSGLTITVDVSQKITMTTISVRISLASSHSFYCNDQIRLRDVDSNKATHTVSRDECPCSRSVLYAR